MPLAGKRTKTTTDDSGTEHEEVFAYTRFTYKSHWFVLSQTEGAEYVAAAAPEWDAEKALASLNINDPRAAATSSISNFQIKIRLPVYFLS
jgi:hypothetical protein